MDYDLYYLKDKKKFVVHFLNKAALSTEDIVDIFSKYGIVRGVTSGGDETGMRFVAYGSLRDTIACIKGLEDDKHVKLLPERSKLKNKKNTQSPTVNKNHTIKKDSANDDLKNKKSKNAETEQPKSNDSNGKSDDNNGKLKSELNELLQDDNQSVTSKRQAVKEMMHNDEQNDIKDFESNEASNKSSQILSTSGESTELSMKSSIIPKKCNGDQRAFNFIKSLTHFERLSQEVDEKSNFEIPDLISADRCRWDRSMESLDEIASCTCSVKESKVVLAQHVVVANVHKDLGIHFILHLFESYDPIAVSLMKTIHGTGIRYCHVYFKNRKDALQVEQIFDNFDLYSERLIVLRSDRLYNCRME